MRFEVAIKLLEQKFEEASKSEYVRDPVAYALYQVWKIADDRGSEKEIKKGEVIKINRLAFKCLSIASPEQYEVYNEDGRIVGYVRLRGGMLTCEYPDIDGKMIYEASIGDGDGMFAFHAQRMQHLEKIANAIIPEKGGQP